MKKLKKISFKEIVIFILIMFVTMTGVIFIQNIDNLDTMWVFSFASKIANGDVPYLDFNMVVTPLSSQLTALFLSIFGNTMVVSAFVGVMYGVIIFLMQYLILRKLNVSKKVSAFIVLISFMLIFTTIVDSYNILAIALVHILLFIEICKIRYDKYVKLSGNKKKYLRIDCGLIYNIITGVLLGLILLTKQNIGGIAVLAITIYYFSKCIYKDLKFKEAFVQLSIKAIFCIIPIAIELLYLYFSGALYYFIDYTILGLSSFGQKVNSSFITAILFPDTIIKSQFIQSWIRNLGMIFSFVFLIVMIVIKCSGKIKIHNKLDMNIMVLCLCFMAVGVIISVPLANQYHLILTATFIEFLFLINFVQILPIQNWLNKNISTLSYYIIIVIPLIIGIGYIAIYSLFTYKSQIDKYENMYISVKTEQLIKNVCTYIQEYEEKYDRPLYVITSNGVMYSMAMDRNNGIFDLPQYGNLGKDDYMKIIDKLDSMNNFAVMIYADDSKLFWQEPKEISKYIKENYQYVDDFDMYKIYYKE